MRSVRRLNQILALAALVALAIGCIVVLLPFWSAILWAVVLCFASWPLFTWVHGVCRGRRTLAAVVTTILISLIFVLPFFIVGPRLAGEVNQVSTTMAELLAKGPPGPPAWVSDLPVVGRDIAAQWIGLLEDGESLADKLRQYLYSLRNEFLDAARVLGQGLVELVMSLVILFFLYRDGKTLGERLSTGVERFAGDRAKSLLEVAGNTTRRVVYGVIGTAMAQGLLATIGFYIVGFDAALFLGLLTFFFSFIPMGPPFVWVPAVIWLFFRDDWVWAVFLLFYGTFGISGVDNILRPYFISRGGHMPFLLVFFGILGGIAAFGFIGVFLGPVLLAVGFSLAKEWSTSATAPAP